MVVAGLGIVLGSEPWNIEGVYRDSALEVSPDGKYTILSVRRQDSNDDGTINSKDYKSLLLIEEGREILCFDEGRFVYRDRMARWRNDGKYIALVLPPNDDWTPYQAADIVVFDPETKTVEQRYRDGINPAWLWDGNVVFQRNNLICIGAGTNLIELDAQEVAGGGDLVLRNWMVDFDHKRIIASFSPIYNRAFRERFGPQRPDGVLVELVYQEDRWLISKLPFPGLVPHPTKDGVFSYLFRGDVNESGAVEIARDGLDLALDGRVVIEDAVFHGFFDFSELRAVLARRNGEFILYELDAQGNIAGILQDHIAVNGATYLFEHQGKVILSAVLGGTEDKRPALYELNANKEFVRIAEPPAYWPRLSDNGILYLRVIGKNDGSIEEIEW